MALVYLIIVMSVLITLNALAVDLGRVILVKTQAQAAADAAALYAAKGVSGGNELSYAQTSLNSNLINGQVVTLQSSDVQTGTWSNNAFTAGGSPINAVQVQVHYTKSRGFGVIATFGQVVGMCSMDVNTTAVATIGPSQNFGIVGLSFINDSGLANDSYDSSSSPTGYITAPSQTGTVESNGSITLSGSAKIDGDAYAGSGHSVSTSGSATVTGTTGTLSTPLSYPNATAGSAATVNNNTSLDTTYFSSGTRDINVSGGHNMTIPAGTYYINNLVLSGGSTITMLGACTFYVTGSVNLSGGSVATASNIPSNFSVNVIGTGAVTVSGSSATYGDFYCPQSDFTISGSGVLGGRVISNGITQSGTSHIYFDTSLGPTTGTPTLVQ